ncbi:MAG: amidase [Gemmataceae bacterium]
MPTTIHATAEAIRQGRLTPLDVLDQCLERIDRLESWVRAWVFVDRDEARLQAQQLTEEAKRGIWRGPLHGIPLGIKDIFDVCDWPTAAGSQRWAQAIARRDATVIERLRRAGAVLLGKTVTTPFASFDPSVTRNPWNAERTPGGSSSGSAAAVACGMCLGALGSQTGGSITRPASFCGVAGCKPTFGRVSCDGVMPLAPSLDHPGPIANCVRDLAYLLQVMAGSDPRDPACSSRPVPDYRAALTRPRGKPRLGRLRGLFEDHAEAAMNRLLDQVTEHFQKNDIQVTDIALPGSFPDVTRRHYDMMAVEGAAFHEARFRRHPEDYPPKIRQLIEDGLACSATDYARSRDFQQQLRAEMLPCFELVDALLAPATCGPAPDASTTGNPMFQAPWSFTGLPTVSFLAGHHDHGMPMCIQLIGLPWSEAELFPVAERCEQVLAVAKRDVPSP